jgi:glutathione S-transferase
MDPAGYLASTAYQAGAGASSGPAQGGAGASSSSSSSSSASAPASVPPSGGLMPSTPRVLYWGSGSPPAWRVLITLHEKALSYRSEMITFESGILKTAPMLSLNPRGLVPIFIDGEVRMYESLAILHYLDDFYPDPPLLPRERVARARALTRMEEANNVSAAAGEVVYYVRRTPPGEINEEYLAAKKAALHTELALWEM